MNRFTPLSKLVIPPSGDLVRELTKICFRACMNDHAVAKPLTTLPP